MNADLHIPDVDTLGNPTGPATETTAEWAVLVHCPISEVPGPHVLSCRESEVDAQRRLDWWQEHCPEALPVLLRREVVTTRGAWEPA